MTTIIKPVNVKAISECAQAIDDYVPESFNRLGYTQNFSLIDTKLTIGYSIAIVAAASFLLDKKLGHNNVIGYQQCLVAAYAILSTIFWYFKKFTEDNTIYQGKNKDGETISLKRVYKEGYPTYTATFKNHADQITIDLEVEKMFDNTGYLQTDLLHRWIKDQLEILKSKKNK